MEEYRQLHRGELVRIIIGTVVNHDVYLGHKGGITAQEVTRLLNQWCIKITLNHAQTRLVELARQGRIERVGRGRYGGV